jgi:hypothetical protein
MPLRCAAMDARSCSWKAYTPKNKFPVLYAHLALKEAQHSTRCVCGFVVLLPGSAFYLIVSCLIMPASSGKLIGSSLALKSFFFFTLCILHQQHFIDLRPNGVNLVFLILVTLVTVFLGF